MNQQKSLAKVGISGQQRKVYDGLDLHEVTHKTCILADYRISIPKKTKICIDSQSNSATLKINEKNSSIPLTTNWTGRPYRLAEEILERNF